MLRVPQSGQDLFCELPCLLERSKLFRGADLLKSHFKGSDKRQLAQTLQKFIAFNIKSFDFLKVEPFLVGTDHSAGLLFRTSNFVGTVPLRSPVHGKQIGDFVVSPRFEGKDRYGSYIQLIDLLGRAISPEFQNDSVLASTRIFRPPFYLEAVKFVSALEQVAARTWRKFETKHEVVGRPSGQVLWSEYFKNEYRVEQRTKYPLRRNVLTENHLEYCQLRYVFDICRDEIRSNQVPLDVRNSFNRRISNLEEKLYWHKPSVTDEIRLRASDPPVIRAAKRQANLVLRQNFERGVAWRVDFNDVFEKLVQHIFVGIARAKGGRLIANPKLHARTNRHFAWELRYVEPDAIYIDNEITLFIDAKYKSHLLNKHDRSEVLREDFRHDLHQVMGYSAFADGLNRTAVLCYPATHPEAKLTKFESRDPRSSLYVLLAGIPMSRAEVPSTISFLGNAIDDLKLIYSL